MNCFPFLLNKAPCFLSSSFSHWWLSEWWHRKNHAGAGVPPAGGFQPHSAAFLQGGDDHRAGATGQEGLALRAGWEQLAVSEGHGWCYGVPSATSWPLLISVHGQHLTFSTSVHRQGWFPASFAEAVDDPPPQATMHRWATAGARERAQALHHSQHDKQGRVEKTVATFLLWVYVSELCSIKWDR